MKYKTTKNEKAAAAPVAEVVEAAPAEVDTTSDTSITDHIGDDTDLVAEDPTKVDERTGIPPCPPSDPNMGMKTPEVVAWWFKYHPDQAKARYGGLTYPEA